MKSNAKGDLVSRKWITNQLTMLGVNGAKSHARAYARCVNEVETAPAVDAAPVVHGRWIPEYEEMETLVGVYGYTQVRNVLTGWSCSVCGRCEGLPREEMPYCHCGAKMDLEEVPKDV